MELICTIKGKSRVINMWFKYFITFLDILMCICILFFARTKHDKASIIGFGAMFLAYAGSVFLMWN